MSLNCVPTRACLRPGHVLRHALVGTQFYDMALSGRSSSTFPSRDAVIRHALVGTQLFDMHGRDTVLHVWSECSFTTCPDWDAVLRHAMVGTQLFGTCPGRDRSFTTCMVGMQFHDMYGRECSFTTCPGLDAVSRHAMVGTQLFGIPGSERRLTP